MQLHFGTQLDERISATPSPSVGNNYCGTQKMLRLLEAYTGLTMPTTDNEYLRPEQYRQALTQYLAQNKTAFFARSFEADALGTATAVLALRDELVGAGVSIAAFLPTDSTDLPTDMGALRLREIAEIENLITHNAVLSLRIGFEDRLSAVIAALPTTQLPIAQVVLHEPQHLLPPIWQRLMTAFAEKKIPIIAATNEAAATNPLSNLGVWQARLLRQAVAQKCSDTADNTIVVLRATRETDAADFLATLFSQHPTLRPLLLIPEQNRALDSAFGYEGLPALGIQSASLARPILQILKLAATFLWRPIDPFKILEFITLPIKPLRDDLAIRLANEMAQAPGINGSRWYAIVEDYFEELELRAATDTTLNVARLREQYNFWFRRTRYDLDKRAPKQDATDLYAYLQQWAAQAFEENGSTQTSLLVLAAQAKRLHELLEALPERDLSYLQLERMVRSVYASSPMQFAPTEVDSLPFVYEESAVIAPTPKLVWWNFGTRSNEHFFARWTAAEIAAIAPHVTFNYLAQAAANETALRLWQRIRPIIQTQQQLILVVPDCIDGSPILEHPLYGELKATFAHWQTMVYDINEAADRERLAYATTPFITLAQSPLIPAVPMLQLPATTPLLRTRDPAQKQYYTDLNTLIEYPYQYVFRRQLKLKSAAMLRVVPDHTLRGNLSHRLFEKLLNEPTHATLTQNALFKWIDTELFYLLTQEGAVLLMYGREPERLQFAEQLKRAAWTFLSALRENNWRVLATEQELIGTFDGVAAAGRTDVVLVNDRHEKCIIDLKWTGAKRRLELLRNGKDLQLVLYAKLLMEQEGQADEWAHAAYFILESGQFVARNTQAFAEAAMPSNTETNHYIANAATYARMVATYRWRMAQLLAGQVEVRTSANLTALAELYENEDMFSLLELPTESAVYDDYRALL